MWAFASSEQYAYEDDMHNLIHHEQVALSLLVIPVTMEDKHPRLKHEFAIKLGNPENPILVLAMWTRNCVGFHFDMLINRHSDEIPSGRKRGRLTDTPSLPTAANYNIDGNKHASQTSVKEPKRSTKRKNTEPDPVHTKRRFRPMYTLVNGKVVKLPTKP